ncbi:MAG: hypothetical protein RMY28_019920 [Nostoc sp. ChiSLP01]
MLRNVGSLSFGVAGIEIAIADLEGWLQGQLKGKILHTDAEVKFKVLINKAILACT